MSPAASAAAATALLWAILHKTVKCSKCTPLGLLVLHQTGGDETRALCECLSVCVCGKCDNACYTAAAQAAKEDGRQAYSKEN